MSGADPSTAERIRQRAESMQRSRARRAYSPLHGLSAFGAIGWSVALPTVLGALLGLWLDRIAPQDFSWTLALMLAGLVLGAIVAWEWVAMEARRTRETDAPPTETESHDE